MLAGIDRLYVVLLGVPAASGIRRWSVFTACVDALIRTSAKDDTAAPVVTCTVAPAPRSRARW